MVARRRASTALASIAVALMCACFVVASPAPVAPDRPGAVRALRDEPPRFGLAYGNTLIGRTDEDLAETLDDAVALGISTVRSDLDWADIQPDSPDAYRWDRFDRIVDGVEARGLTLLLVLAYTPQWARPAGCDSHMCPPADPDRFADFAQAAVERYGSRGVIAWEIWNEPNDAGFWAPKADPAAFSELLTAASKAIRAADPSAIVVLGGMASLQTGARALSPADFLREVCRYGGIEAVSAIGFHPYTYPYLPSESKSGNSPWSRIEVDPDSLRNILTACGRPELPIWLTEYGSPTGGPGSASDGSPGATTDATTHTTEARQAAIASDVLRTVARDRSVQALIWYSDRDLGTNASTNLNFYGLRRDDGSEKPAYAAFRQTLAELGLSRR